MKQLILNALALLAVGLILGACNKSKGPSDQPQGHPQQEFPQPPPYPPGPQPFPPGPNPPQVQGQVCFFQFPNFQGQSFCLRPGMKKDYLVIWPMHGRAPLFQSIRIEGNARAILYPRPGFRGPKVRLRQSVPSTIDLYFRLGVRSPAASVEVVASRARPAPMPPPKGPGPGRDDDDEEDRDPRRPPRQPENPDDEQGDDDEIPTPAPGPGDDNSIPDDEEQGPDDEEEDRRPDPRNDDRGRNQRPNENRNDQGRAGSVCFFTEPGFQGRSFCLEPGAVENDLESVGWSTFISSIKVEGDASVFVYLKSGLSGESKLVLRSVSDLTSFGAKWNDSITSVRVARSGGK